MRAGVTAVLGGLLWLLALPLLAQAPSESADAIEAGVVARERGADAEALGHFQRAFEVDGSPEALVQMGLAEQALGRWLDAERHLSAGLEHTDDAWIASHRELLERELTALRARLGRLEVVGGPPGAEVVIEGEVVATLPQPAPVYALPGRVRVLVRLEGHVPAERTVEVLANTLSRESVTLRPTPRVVTPDVEPTVATTEPLEEVVSESHSSDTSSDPTLLALGIGALALGVVAVAVGGALMAVREDRAMQWNSDDCLGTDPSLSRDDNCRDVRESAEVAEGAAIGLFVGGAALSIAGIVMSLLWSSDDADDVACGGGPGEVGWSCRAVF